LSVLYLTYNGLTEPLGRRQVLPYVLGLARRGWRYEIVSFEKRETRDAARTARVREELASVGASWCPLPYHRRPTLAATAYDCVRGVIAGLRRRKGVRLIHARSTVPAAQAALLARMLRVPWIYDVRGLVAQEYLDAGHWSRRSLPYRLTETCESSLLRSADGLVFLTKTIRETLRTSGRIPLATPLAVIPCCADTAVFAPDDAARHRIRSQLSLGTRPILVYAGSLGSWYCMEEMLDFFDVARGVQPGLHFLVLTMNAEIAHASLGRRASARDVSVLRVPPEEVPQYLAAADAGICFLTDSVSKRASSPTKYGEYLASGLPVITNRWTGDAREYEGERAWILVDSFDRECYDNAAQRLRELLSEPDAARDAARRLAEREYSLETALERYHALYTSVLSRAGDSGTTDAQP
jgi:glycosyltransferase involved in cell wall biosynthesis